MEAQETPEAAARESRGRQGKTIPIALNLGMTDHSNMSACQLRMMRRSGEDITRERVVSEALQCLMKTLSSHE